MTSVDDVLADAEILADEYADYDTTAARRRIALRVTRALQDRARPLDGVPQPVTPAATPLPDTGRHQGATRYLEQLSALIVHGHQASTQMSQLVNSRLIEPEGALVFACLLHLADRGEAARFWWQFAAGAGNAVSAYCLYLHHTQHGEPEDADYWLEQSAGLDVKPRGPSPAPLALGRDFQDTSTFIEFIACLCPHGPNHALEAAIARLEDTSDADYGTIPKPDPHLADQLSGASRDTNAVRNSALVGSPGGGPTR